MKREILRLEHINKTISNYKILDDFKLNIYQGELVSLVGLRGCGKEELGATLSGLGGIDTGNIYFEEKPCDMLHMFSAEKLGIFSLFENNILIPQLSVAENIFVIWKNSLFRFIVNKKTAEEQAAYLLRSFGLLIEPGMKGKDLNSFEQQMVKLVKAYVKGARLLIANDIAGTYSNHEFKILMRILNRLKQDGVSILWITSKLDSVTAASDRVIIMRNGKNIRTFFNPDINHIVFLKAYLEEETSATLLKKAEPSEEVVFELKQLYSKYFHGFGFKVYKSELLGILDVRNSGKKELEEILTGEKIAQSCSMHLIGKEYSPACLRDAIRLGLGYIREKDIEVSFVPSMKVIDNIMLPLMDGSRWRNLFINNKLKKYIIKSCVGKFNFDKKELQADLLGRESEDVFLHRALYARWYFSFARLLLCVEPFSRLDIQKRSQLTDILEEILSNRVGIVILSVNIQDLLSVCDRILIVKNGQISNEYRKEFFNEIDFDALYL